MVDSSTSLTLDAEAPRPYVHLDNRALVLCNGSDCVILPSARFPWVRETFALIADERRATRTQGDHVPGGFFDGGGVVLFAGGRDAITSVRLAAARSRRCASASRRSGRAGRPPHSSPGMLRSMRSHTAYMTFETPERRQFVRITDDVQRAVDEAGVSEGMVLVSAMHITAGVWVNDDEPGLLEDTLEWLDKIAPPSWKEPANDVARELGPDPGDFRHHRGGEDNGDAHWKNLLVHHQVVLPITDGRLDLGPWQAVFYAEFDGRRSKRLVIKVLGE